MRSSSMCSADELQTEAYTSGNPFIKEQVINRKTAIESKTDQGHHRFNKLYFFVTMLITKANNLSGFFFKANLQRKCKYTGQGNPT